jgi:hypothetical protein
MFEFLLETNTADAIAGVHYALRRIAYRKLVPASVLAARESRSDAGAAPEVELGWRIVEEIERKEKATLGQLSESTAARYKHELYQLVQQLSGLGAESPRYGKQILEDWRNNPVGGVGATEMPRLLSPRHTAALGIYLVGLIIVLITVVAISRPQEPLSSSAVVMIAAAMGALGGALSAARSFANYAGNRMLLASWALWFLFRPVGGAGFAVLFAIVFLGSFGLPGSTRGYYQFAALSALVGMFADQAMQKLTQIGDALFRVRTESQRRDRL